MSGLRENVNEYFKLYLFVPVFGWIINRILKGGNMEKDVQLGPEAVLKMSVVGGKVVVEADYEGKQLGAGAKISMDIDQYLELLKAAIPGTVDDVIIDGLEAALKYVP